MAKKRLSEPTELERLRIDADLRELTIKELRRALSAFNEYDGDGDLWGHLVQQRDRAYAALAFILDKAKCHRDLTDSNCDRDAWRKVVDLSYKALGNPSIAAIDDFKARAL